MGCGNSNLLMNSFVGLGPKLRPQVDNVENFVVVWLDASIGSNADTQKSKDQLQKSVNSIKIFTDPDQCRTFIHSVKDEKIFLIISATLGEQFIPTVQQVTQIDSIYVFCSNKSKHKDWIKNFPEIRDLYTSIKPLCEQLGKDTKKCDHDLVGFEVVERSMPTIVTKTNQKEALIMYDQLFREIMLAAEETDMTDMYDFCQMSYKENREALKFLSKLRTTYDKHSPVWWYSQEAFLYRMVNRALRTHQYETLYALRVFIRQLHETIVGEQKKTDLQSIKLYRGQGMEEADFRYIRENEGGLLLNSNFLSTSTEREVALGFAKATRHDRNKVSVLMELTVDKNSSVPFANIRNQSAFKKEEEWLFSMGTIFRIGPSTCQSDGIWVIELTLTDVNNEQSEALKTYLKKSMVDKNSRLNFAKLTYQLTGWEQSKYFYLMSLDIETDAQRKAAIYHNLGLVTSQLEQYDEALKYYQESLQLKQRDNTNKYDYTSTYNNIATLYYKQKKMDLAIENFQKAINEYNKRSQKDKDLEATIRHNISHLFNDRGKYKRALKNNERCLDIRSNSLPTIHPSMATTYSSIANTFHCLCDLNQAARYAQKAVDIDIQALPPNHPQTQAHMHNLEFIRQGLVNRKKMS